MAYVAPTRHRESVVLHWSAEAVENHPSGRSLKPFPMPCRSTKKRGAFARMGPPGE